ncbi:hypothetical protein KAH81_05755 [bacterium]|nr:hypothetical protein [bacterium]
MKVPRHRRAGGGGNRDIRYKRTNDRRYYRRGDPCVRPSQGQAHGPVPTTIWQLSAVIGSGVYLVRASVGDESVTKRIIYLK